MEEDIGTYGDDGANDGLDDTRNGGDDSVDGTANSRDDRTLHPDVSADALSRPRVARTMMK